MSDAIFKIWGSDKVSADQTAEKERLVKETQPARFAVLRREARRLT